jgi:hypothetical protein
MIVSITSLSGNDVWRRTGPVARPAPSLSTGKGLQVQVRLQPDMVDMVDGWIAAQPKPVSRPEAIRQMLAELHLAKRQPSSEPA